MAVEDLNEKYIGIKFQGPIIINQKDENNQALPEGGPL